MYEGGGGGRYFLNNGIISIGASTFAGGSVDSIMFDGMEFVQGLAHGRQIQVCFKRIIQILTF